MRWPDRLDIGNGLGQVQRIKCDTLTWVAVKKCQLLNFKEQECIPVGEGGVSVQGGLCPEGGLCPDVSL